MSTFIEQIHEKAKKGPKKVVLQEGEDVRVIEAAGKATKLGIAEVTLLGDPAKIKATAASASLSLDKVNVVDMTQAPNMPAWESANGPMRATVLSSVSGRTGLPLTESFFISTNDSSAACRAMSRCSGVSIIEAPRFSSMSRARTKWPRSRAISATRLPVFPLPKIRNCMKTSECWTEDVKNNSRSFDSAALCSG